MAVATATILAVGGLAVAGGSAAMSFSQASKQKKLQQQAEAKAAESMAAARKRLEVNFAENLSIQKEPFELQREAMLSQGALAIQAGVESDRGAEATAGRVQMAQNEGQAQIRGAMGQELMNIEQQVVNEDSRLRDIGVQLDLGEVEGAQLAARDAQEARAAAISEGVQSATSAAQMGVDMVPLFAKTAAANQFAKLQQGAQKAKLSQADFQNKIAELGASNPVFGKLAGVGELKADAFQSAMTNLSPQEIKAIRESLKF